MSDKVRSIWFPVMRAEFHLRSRDVVVETLVTWSVHTQSVTSPWEKEDEHESMQKEHTLVVHARSPDCCYRHRFSNLVTLDPQDYPVERVGWWSSAKSQKRVSLRSKARLLGKLALPRCENYTPWFNIISLPA
jgi:hypothetical protein